MPGTEPIKPTGTPTQIKVGQGESLSVLAQKYNTTVALIKKANNMTSDNVREGQILTINVVTDKEQKDYEKLRAQYDLKVAEEKEQLEVEKRTAQAQCLIDKAQKDGYGKEYNFSINNKGHVIVTLKADKKLGDISDDFGLEDGVLRGTNPSIEQRYKIGKAARNSDGEEYETWDNVQAKAGDTFVVDTNDFQTTKTWSQRFSDAINSAKEWWNNLTK